MAVTVLSSSDRLTAAEIIKRGANGISADQRRIVELLSITNEMLLDAPIVQANDGTVNTSVVRTALPHGTKRVYNQGVGVGASQTDTIHDVCAQVAIYSEVDEDLVNNSADKAETLQSEEVAFIEGLSQDMADDIFYGNHSKDPAAIDGFATRRAKLEAKKCLSAGGTTANKQTSIYLIKWGQNNVKLMYPKGASGLGVQVKPKGVQTVDAPDGKGKMEAYQTYYKVDYGIIVKNDAALIRIANIDMSKDMTDAEAQALILKIIKAKAYLPQGDGTISILCNADIMSVFDQATLTKSNVVYTSTDPWGKAINMLRDMRIRRCDSIVNTEAVVS